MTSSSPETTSISPSKPHKQPQGASVGSSVASLCNCVIGSGVLALPFAVKCSGMGLGLFFLFLIALGSGASFYFLMGASNHFHSYSYKDIARRLTPGSGGWFGTLAEVFCLLYTLGTICGYGVVVCGSMRDVISDIKPELNVSPWIILALLMLIMLPLSLLTKLDFLKFTSVAAVLGVFYITCVIIWRLCVSDPALLEATHGPILAITETPKTILKTFPLIGVAFTAHYACLAIYKELNAGADDAEAYEQLVAVDTEGEYEEDKPVRRNKEMNKVVLISMVICIAFYAVMGATGYALFRRDVDPYILHSFVAGSGIDITIARVAILLTILFSYPIVSFSLRRSLCTLLLKGDDTPYWQQALISVGLAVFVYVIGSLQPPLDTVLRLSGSLFGTVIVYIIPGFFWTQVGAAEKAAFKADATLESPDEQAQKKYKCVFWTHSLPGWSVVTLGVTVFILGSTSIINDLIKK